jgi:divalent metal cation (Fe/Co/Zn/Cd) transporter
MNFSLKPNPLIAVWVPGFLTLTAILFIAYLNASVALEKLMTTVPPGFLAFWIIIAGLAVGELLDTIRDLSENLWDRICKINWDFFFDADERHLRNLEEWYYTYYELDANLFLGILVTYVLAWLRLIRIDILPQCIMAIPTLIFLLGVISMRREIKNLIDDYYEKTDKTKRE